VLTDGPPTHGSDVTRTGASSSYDQIPYTSHAFAQTHPDRLATIARIFRLSPPDIASCRVLELGCASGGNLIPMAFNLPGSEFVGIDFSRHQVNEGQEVVNALGIRNIRIEHASILDVNDDWGRFDYVLCHGVFSWVDAEVQDKILAIASRNLTTHGIAYVSYNTYPGWHMRQMVRDMMRYHAGQFSDPQEQVDQARALLKFIVSASEDTGPYNQLLRSEAERLGRSPDSYIYHEHLEQTNLPIYFHQFIERAEANGLQYLSEAAVSEMLTAHFPPSIASTLERISPDLLHLEQYMDFARHRQFRQTLLCHEDVHPSRALTPDVLQGLLLSSFAKPGTHADLAPGVPIVFTNGSKRAEVSSPATKAALTVLLERWPCAIAVSELCAIAMERAAAHPTGKSADEVREAMLEDLFGGVMYGLIDLHTQPLPCTNSPSDMPRAHPVSALQAKSGSFVVNAHHRMFELDALAREVLKLSNGRRSRQEIVDVFMEWFEAGRLDLEADGQPIRDPQAARAMLTDRVTRAIANLTHAAVLVE
jgi:methyltransferase-like protein/cyclopropane fatty-acyl-phospholipid synthase-like methyltransferase